MLNGREPPPARFPVTIADLPEVEHVERAGDVHAQRFFDVHHRTDDDDLGYYLALTALVAPAEEFARAPGPATGTALVAALVAVDGARQHWLQRGDDGARLPPETVDGLRRSHEQLMTDLDRLRAALG